MLALIGASDAALRCTLGFARRPLFGVKVRAGLNLWRLKRTKQVCVRGGRSSACNIQSALNKRRDSGRSSGTHCLSPTVMLEQMKERLRNIAQDMYILNKSCGEEIVRSSLARAWRTAPKKMRRARRNRVKHVKHACSDTIEETISSTDEVAHHWVAKAFKTHLHGHICRTSLTPRVPQLLVMVHVNCGGTSCFRVQ